MLKDFIQKFPAVVIYLLVSVALFVYIFFGFLLTSNGEFFQCENLAHTYTCSFEEAGESAIAWAIIVQVLAQVIIFPAVIILQAIHWFLRKKTSFFKDYPFWSLGILTIAFGIISLASLFLLYN